MTHFRIRIYSESHFEAHVGRMDSSGNTDIWINQFIKDASLSSEAKQLMGIIHKDLSEPIQKLPFTLYLSGPNLSRVDPYWVDLWWGWGWGGGGVWVRVGRGWGGLLLVITRGQHLLSSNHLWDPLMTLVWLIAFWIGGQFNTKGMPLFFHCV